MRSIICVWASLVCVVFVHCGGGDDPPPPPAGLTSNQIPVFKDTTDQLKVLAARAADQCANDHQQTIGLLFSAYQGGSNISQLMTMLPSMRPQETAKCDDLMVQFFLLGKALFPEKKWYESGGEHWMLKLLANRLGPHASKLGMTPLGFVSKFSSDAAFQTLVKGYLKQNFPGIGLPI